VCIERTSSRSVRELRFNVAATAHAVVHCPRCCNMLIRHLIRVLIPSGSPLEEKHVTCASNNYQFKSRLIVSAPHSDDEFVACEIILQTVRTADPFRRA
jgi:hypothetical protein